MNTIKTQYALLLILADFITILTAFVIAYIARVTFDPRPLIEQISSIEYLQIFLILLPFWLIIFAALGLYNDRVYSNRFSELWRLLLGTFIGMLIIIGYEFVTEAAVFPARLVAAYGFVLGAGLLILQRQLMWQLRKLGYRRRIGVERVMIVGNAPATKELTRLLGHTLSSGVEIVAIVGQKSNIPAGFEGLHFSSLPEALQAIQTMRVTTIIQTKLYEQETRNWSIQQAALDNHLEYKLMLAESNLYSGSVSVELFHYFPVIAVHPTPLLGWGRVVKRAFDMTVAFFALVALSPIMVLSSLILLVNNFGPILFKQKRITRGGREFDVYKFRTMKHGLSGRDDFEVFKELGRPELMDEYVKRRGQLVDDPRVTSWGKIMRKWSIDELPQLFNVLKGDISLVGPRTIRRAEAEQSFRDKTPLILSVKTGITGLAQVSGRTHIPIEERVKLDQYYVQNWSLWLDIKILFKTIRVVLTRSGAE